VVEGDGFAALTRYRHAALQFRVSAVIPLVPGTLDLEGVRAGHAPDLPPAASSAQLHTLRESGVPAGTRAGEPRGTTPSGSVTAGIDTPRTRPPR
jgi:hypothetical protein